MELCEDDILWSFIDCDSLNESTCPVLQHISIAEEQSIALADRFLPIFLRYNFLSLRFTDSVGLAADFCFPFELVPE